MSPILIPAIWFLINCTIAWPLVVLSERSSNTNAVVHVLWWFFPTAVWCIMAAGALAEFGERTEPNWGVFWFFTVIYVGVEIVNLSAVLIGLPDDAEESDPRAA